MTIRYLRTKTLEFRYITQQGPEDPFLSELDDRSSDTYPANISTHSPLSVAAFNHRISIFAARLPPKKHIITALREKALYVFGLIMMMAWSVTYHSWITFILLLWSCYLWMARNRDQVTLKHAKWITLYAIVLILLQFVYSLNLYSNSELPAKLSNELSNEDDTLKTFGLRKKFRKFCFEKIKSFYVNMDRQNESSRHLCGS